VFKALNNKSLIDAIYTIASYTYGPLLGMFSFGLLCKRKVNDKLVPYIAILSPLICYGLNLLTSNLFNYPLGYELLIINGLITFGGMWIISTSHNQQKIN
jgi:hypothetical protein